MYVHFMTSLDTDQTLEAKMVFERVALNHSVTIRPYRVDISCFSDLALKKIVSRCNNNSPSVGLVLIIRTGMQSVQFAP